MYDIIVITNSYHPSYEALIKKYPFVKKAKNFHEAQSSSLTTMFWIIWENILVNENFDFKFTPPEYDKKYVHVFPTANPDLPGVCLFPKDLYVSSKELEYYFFANSKKQEKISAIERLYDVFYPTSYEDYLKIFETASTDMYWIVHPSLEVLSEFKFDFIIDKYNDYEKNITHIFLNRDIDVDIFDGILLCSKNVKLTREEFETRILNEKKEQPILASRTKMYDMFFISYHDPLANEKFIKIKKQFPRIKHIKNINGIHNSHKQAATVSSTPMFWVIDSDAIIVDDFKFDILLPKYDHDSVFVWHSKNPVNDLEYGYGGIKLLPKDLTTYVNLNSIDMTLSISQKINIVEEVSNITVFNTDPFNAWKSAFRECVKLSLKSKTDKEAEDRLTVWCTIGKERTYGSFVIDGANEGRKYAEENADNKSALLKINDFKWVRTQFELRVEIMGNTLEITAPHTFATS
jgi:hypothetical protein